MNLEIKPYLKEVSELYKKIHEFETAVKLKHTYSPLEGTHYYRNEDIDTVMDEFSERLDFVPEELNELKSAMHSGKVDFMRLQSDEETLPEDEFQLLYILSRPFFRSMKNAMDLDNTYWKNGRCPVCAAVPSLSTIEKESRRTYHCSLCGTSGHYLRIGCPNCLSENPHDITIIHVEGEEGMRADTCEQCKSYCKSFDGELTMAHSLDLLDIISLPLDIIAQEKGFKRHSPNPVGMIRME